ncbi:MAG: carboxypeptidase-like regulatory domain-containing protein [Planctomycetota bacterium]
MWTTSMRLMCVLSVGIVISGCSQGGVGAKPRATTYKVTGNVTYLGNPLVGATVSFSPQGKYPAAVGRTNDSGEFSLMTYSPNDGAAAGDYSVLVVLVDSGEPEAPAAAHSPDGRNMDPTGGHSAMAAKRSRNILPAKYADPEKTDLTAKVDPNGENKFTFALK